MASMASNQTSTASQNLYSDSCMFAADFFLTLNGQ